MKKIITVDIEKMVYGGQGMGHTNGKVVFVPFAAPGDRVTVEILREKKNYLEGELQTIEKQSPARVQPFCAVFGRCGGCQLQHLSYGDQISAKEENLRGALRPLLRKSTFEVLPTIPSPHTQAYRTRAQLKAGQDRGKTVLGFYSFKSRRIVAIDQCPLLHPAANRILQELYLNLGRWKGEMHLRNADILVSPFEERGVIQLTGIGTDELIFMEELVRESLVIKGAHLKNTSEKSWGDLQLRFHLPGRSPNERIEMHIPANSFFQVNPYQNENLIKTVQKWANLKGKEKVLDLFCGAGNLTLPLAHKAEKIWGVDADKMAIAAAKENARLNRLGKCVFLSASAQNGTSEVLGETDHVDLIVLDPPRAGALEALANIARLHPQKILYVSCEPPTLVRDLVRLGELGYNVTRIQPVDMFPQTYHLEVIAELREGAHRR
jgi:23S rRNA (uracil1939-C5)-methyltransferase